MKKIVTIGGGTGSFTLLSGLKNYSIDISAVVSMADDGGSTGRLRDELGVLPPGDIRQCLVALSDSSDKLRDLMNYRFDSGDLKGHNFGNLLLSALEKINGNFTEGIREAARILNIKGRVLPVSEKDMNLAIKLNNKEVVVGEKYLDHNEQVRKHGVEKVFLKPQISANKKVLKAIKEADVIILGPGDHYGSIIPNLLVGGIAKAICKSKATVIYNCNLTNKKGQTEDFDVDNYAREMNSYLGQNRIDYVIYPSKRPKEELIKKYEKREGKNSIVKLRDSSSEERPYKIVKADITTQKRVLKRKNDAIADTRSFIRHDSKKLAKVMMLLSERDEYRQMIKEIV
jgi:uncharacterized cofD-like protein